MTLFEIPSSLVLTPIEEPYEQNKYVFAKILRRRTRVARPTTLRGRGENGVVQSEKKLF